jgi:putative membrane protein
LLGWHPHLDIWALVAALLGGYFLAVRTLGPRFGPPFEPAATRRQKQLFVSGVLCLWFALDWPMHELAEAYLFSAHMVQHILLMLVAPPLLIGGMPPWLLRRIVGRGARLEMIRRITRPLPALVIFNGMIAFIHWPAVVEAMSRSEPVHVAVHGLVVGASINMWLPVLSPLLEIPQLSYPGRMFYLFLTSIVPTVPASFLTFASEPFYRGYAEATRILALSPLDDLRIAGLIMKLGGGLILWGFIAVLFFRWYALEQTEGIDVLAWRDVDRELNRMKVDGP